MVRRSIIPAIKDTIYNPIILIPLLAQIILVAITALVLFILLTLLQQYVFVGPTSLEGFIQSLFTQPLALLVSSILFLVSLVAVLFIVAFFDAGYFTLVQEGIVKKARLCHLVHGAKKHFASFAAFLFLKYLTITVYVFVMLVLWLLIPLLSIIWVLLIGIGILFFTLAFLFAPMHIVKYNLSGMKAYTRALSFFLNNKLFVLIASIIAFLVVIVLSLVLFFVQLITEPIRYLSGLIDLLVFVINLFLALFISFFLFRIFLEKEKKATK